MLLSRISTISVLFNDAVDCYENNASAIDEWMNEWMSSVGRMTLTGRNGPARRKPCRIATLSTTNPTRTNVVSNMFLCRDRSASNRLSRALHGHTKVRCILDLPRDGTHTSTQLQSRTSRDSVKLFPFLWECFKPSVKNPTKIPVNNKVSSFSLEGRCERLCVYLFVVGR